MKYIIYLFLSPFIILIYIFKGLFFLIKKSSSKNNENYYNRILDYDLVTTLKRDGKLRKSLKRPLVQITSHGGACHICQKWEKKILIDDIYSGGTKNDGNYELLSAAIKAGLFHKKCRHGLTTYYPEAEGIENYTDEEYEEDVEWINNRIHEIK